MALRIFGQNALASKLTGPADSRTVERAQKISCQTSVRRSTAAASIDGLEDAISVLDDTCTVLETLRNRIKNLSEPVLAASVEPDAATRALFADEYDDRRETVGENLMGPQDGANVLLGDSVEPLSVTISNSFSYRIGKFQLLPQTEGLALPAPLGAFNDNEDIVSVLRAIENALNSIDRALAHYRQDKAFLENKLATYSESVVAS